MGGMSASDFLWTIQYRVIQDLAEKGPCVIVGRCADYILREREDCLHTFIHASVPFRADRIVRLYGESEKAPEKRLADKDTRRRVNYKYYTDREWGMAQSYIDLLTRHKEKLLCIRDRLLFDENGAAPILTIKNAECPL